jgi:hypothetical protein
MNNAITRYLSSIGRNGGAAASEAQREAGRNNLAKARAALKAEREAEIMRQAIGRACASRKRVIVAKPDSQRELGSWRTMERNRK